MSKVFKSRSRGNFTLKFSNNKTIRFRTRDAYSNACEVISKGRFANVGEMYSRVKQMPTGFEYVETDKKSREYEKRFNGIEIED
jgi:hypothetical protein